MQSSDLEKLHAVLAVEPRTTAQVAISCKWSLDAAFANLVELEGQGLVARASSRPINSAAVQWRLVSGVALTVAIERAAKEDGPAPAAEPDAPAPAWAATADAQPRRRVTKAAASASEALNPYEAPTQAGESAPDHDAAAERQRRFEAKGNFWLGFVAGIVVGPIAYLLTTSSAPQTNRGASWGAATQFTAFVVWRVILG